MFVVACFCVRACAVSDPEPCTADGEYLEQQGRRIHKIDTAAAEDAAAVNYVEVSLSFCYQSELTRICDLCLAKHPTAAMLVRWHMEQTRFIFNPSSMEFFSIYRSRGST